jgi:hypothetical protein
MARRLTFEAALTAAERDEPFSLFATRDYHEGYTAFLSKTAPVFTGT